MVDRGGMLVGVVSQTDFMHLANPDVRSLIHHKASGIRIGEVMSRPPVTVLLSTPLVEAARLMVGERVHGWWSSTTISGRSAYLRRWTSSRFSPKGEPLGLVMPSARR